MEKLITILILLVLALTGCHEEENPTESKSTVTTETTTITETTASTTTAVQTTVTTDTTTTKLSAEASTTAETTVQTEFAEPETENEAEKVIIIDETEAVQEYEQNREEETAFKEDKAVELPRVPFK